MLTWHTKTTPCITKVTTILKITKSPTWLEVVSVSGTIITPTTLVIGIIIIPGRTRMWSSTVPERHERLISAFC